MRALAQWGAVLCLVRRVQRHVGVPVPSAPAPRVQGHQIQGAHAQWRPCWGEKSGGSGSGGARWDGLWEALAPSSVSEKTAGILSGKSCRVEGGRRHSSSEGRWGPPWVPALLLCVEGTRVQGEGFAGPGDGVMQVKGFLPFCSVFGLYSVAAASVFQGSATSVRG